MKVLTIPYSLRAEHARLHSELKNAIKSGGNTGKAANAVADFLHLHFVNEEEYALPPLGFLSLIAAGQDNEVDLPMKKEIIAMSDRLASDLSQMLQEHQSIVMALDDLRSAAEAEQKHEVAHFADKLILHAKNEEEVLYPAAIIVGRYLKATESAVR